MPVYSKHYILFLLSYTFAILFLYAAYLSIYTQTTKNNNVQLQQQYVAKIHIVTYYYLVGEIENLSEGTLTTFEKSIKICMEYLQPTSFRLRFHLVAARGSPLDISIRSFSSDPSCVIHPLERIQVSAERTYVYQQKGHTLSINMHPFRRMYGTYIYIQLMQSRRGTMSWAAGNLRIEGVDVIYRFGWSE